MTDEVEVGTRVKFTGFTGEENPDNGSALKKNTTYPVVEIQDDDTEDTVFVVEVANPDYDDSKRKSKGNQPNLKVELFDDEFTPAKGKSRAKTPAKTAAPAKETTAKKTTTKKPAAKKPAAKKPAAKKPAAKSKSKAKSKLKETDEEAGAHDGLFEGMLVLQEHEENAEVLTMIDEADDLCELAQEVCEEAANIDYQLGGILYHVRLSGAHKELHDDYAGNKGFDAYCEAELGIKYRKAMYLIDIYTKFSRYGIDSEKVASMGWTKAMEIARVMDEDNAEELVELAEESSVVDLKDSITESYAKKGADNRPKVKRVSFNFRLPEESGATITEYIEQAGQELGIDDNGQVFEHIVTEWATEHLNIKKARGKGRKKAA